MAGKKTIYRSVLMAAGLLIAMTFLISAVIPGLMHTIGSVAEDDRLDAGNLKVCYLDAGQADAIFIQLPNGAAVVIDSGDGSDQAKIAGRLKEAGISRIDAFVATHPHADHIGGMAYLIGEFETGMIYMPKVSSTTKTFENLLLAIANKKLKVTTAKAGLMISPDPEVKIEIIAPSAIIPDEINENSVVIRLDYGKTSFLFMGDAGIIVEEALMEAGENLKADVIKIGHHGSTYSSGLPFLMKVQPAIAVISVGKGNDYGHPSQSVIERLSGMGARILRTDKDGDIIMISDGDTIDVLS